MTIYLNGGIGLKVRGKKKPINSYLAITDWVKNGFWMQANEHEIRSVFTYSPDGTEFVKYPPASGPEKSHPDSLLARLWLLMNTPSDTPFSFVLFPGQIVAVMPDSWDK